MIDAKYAVRSMEVDDIPQVSEIDRESFPTMWPPVAYKRELLHNRLARYIVAYEIGSENRLLTEAAPGDDHSSPSGLGRVFSGIKGLFGNKETQPEAPPKPQQKLVGMAGLWFMVDEAHITTIAVREAYRRQGIGELLLINCVELAAARECRFVTLEVRVTNTGAQRLYEKYGFARTGLRKGYYTDNHEDALIMSTDVVSSDSYQALLQGLKSAYTARHGVVSSPRSG